MDWRVRDKQRAALKALTDDLLSFTTVAQKLNEGAPENGLFSLPDYVIQAGLPDYVIQAGLPDYVIQAGLPDYVIQAGLPDYVIQAGLPDYVIQAGFSDRLF